jgi:hypothetical protein
LFLTVAELRRQLDLLDPPPDAEIFYEPPATEPPVIVPVLGVAVVGHFPEHSMIYLVTSVAMNKPRLFSTRDRSEEAS